MEAVVIVNKVKVNADRAFPKFSPMMPRKSPCCGRLSQSEHKNTHSSPRQKRRTLLAAAAFHPGA